MPSTPATLARTHLPKAVRRARHTASGAEYLLQRIPNRAGRDDPRAGPAVRDRLRPVARPAAPHFPFGALDRYHGRRVAARPRGLPARDHATLAARSAPPHHDRRRRPRRPPDGGHHVSGHRARRSPPSRPALTYVPVMNTWF